MSSNGGHRRHKSSPRISARTRSVQQSIADAAATRLLDPDPFVTYQAQAAIAAVEPKEKPNMPDANPSPIQAQINALNGEIRLLASTLQETRNAMGTIRQAVLNLEATMEDLRDGRVQFVERDPNLDKVLALFERVAPLRLSYTDIAEELELTNDAAYRLVIRLEKEGKLQVHERRNEGSTRTFRKWSAV